MFLTSERFVWRLSLLSYLMNYCKTVLTGVLPRKKGQWCNTWFAEILEIDPSDVVHVRAAGCAHVRARRKKQKISSSYGPNISS